MTRRRQRQVLAAISIAETHATALKALMDSAVPVAFAGSRNRKIPSRARSQVNQAGKVFGGNGSTEESRLESRLACMDDATVAPGRWPALAEPVSANEFGVSEIMAHPTGETSNNLLAALEELEVALAEDSQLFAPTPEP